MEFQNNRGRPPSEDYPPWKEYRGFSYPRKLNSKWRTGKSALRSF